MINKINRRIFPVSFACILFVLFIGGNILVSCKTSHSVKNIRASRDPNGGYIPTDVKVKARKTTDDALVKDLFLQSKRPSIELPYVKEANKGAAIISEQVTYTHAESVSKTSSDINNEGNLNDLQHLDEVVVTAKSKFTPEQDGRVNIDFVLKVPKELLSTNYRVTLNPKLLHNDSVVALNSLLLKGEEFKKRQKQGYQDYEDFLNSIVKKSDYDSVFVDHTGVKEDIRNQQQFYYEQYHKEWSRQVDYEDWKTRKDKADALAEASRQGYDMKLYYENVRKAREAAMKEVAKGKDTTGFFTRYMGKAMKSQKIEKVAKVVDEKTDYRHDFYKEYSRKAREKVQRDWADGKDTIGAYNKYMKAFDGSFKTMVLDGEDLNKIPDRFRDLYKTGRELEQIDIQQFTEGDSLQIAQARYKYDEIAINEMKDAMREDKKEELIIFPYEEGARLDTVIQTDKDFVYHYTQSYPVSPGLKNIRLVLNTDIDAIDRSRFVQPYSDTLSYFISSLSQLVDTSLIVKRTTIHRDMYNTMTVYPKFQPNKHLFNVNYKDNKEQTDTLINVYRTFTNEAELLMDSIMIRVSTSLDGSYDKNHELSNKRAEALKAYFVKTLGDENLNFVFKTRQSGEDWNTLARLISRRDDLLNKEAILDTLRQAVYPDQTELNIKKLYPEEYKIIKDSIYPLLNRADIVFNMKRPDVTEEVTVKVEVRPDYEKALDLLQDRKYWDALDILYNYPDYNTALCLVCMGYNAKALDLIETLKQTGNTEYLLAILAVRAKNEDLAIKHLLKACELDQTKIYRSLLDPEIAILVNKYSLQERMEQLDTPIAVAP